MSLKLKDGFTILELLIVIAVITILAAVVIVAMDRSRTGGKDAAIKAQLQQARLQAELYREDFGGKYCDYDGGSSCFWGASNGSNTAYCGDRSKMVFDDSVSQNANTIGRFITAAEALAPLGDPNFATKCFMDDYGSQWVVALKLNNPSNGWWCVDSFGSSVLVVGDSSDVRDAIDPLSADPKCP